MGASGSKQETKKLSVCSGKPLHSKCGEMLPPSAVCSFGMGRLLLRSCDTTVSVALGGKPFVRVGRQEDDQRGACSYSFTSSEGTKVDANDGGTHTLIEHLFD